MTNVLGVIGSPRRRGNTETLVDEALRGAREAGARVEKIILSRLNILPCTACESCRKMDSCIKKDDMQNIYRLMEESQIWVLGTPVYWWGPTAQFKLFVDRWYGAMNSMRVKFKGKKVILVVPFESGNRATARNLQGMFDDIFKYLGIELMETVLAPGVVDPGEISAYPKIIKTAFEAGFRSVSGRET